MKTADHLLVAYKRQLNIAYYLYYDWIYRCI